MAQHRFNALADAHAYKGDMVAAYEARLEALKACKAAGDIYLIIVTNLKVAITLRSQGQLQRTIEICQQQIQFANEFGLSQTRAVGWLLAIWGEVLAELNDLDGAIDKAKKGVELTEGGGDLAMIGWSYMCLDEDLIFQRGYGWRRRDHPKDGECRSRIQCASLDHEPDGSLAGAAMAGTR